MHTAQEIISEASDLPVQARVAIVDALPLTLNKPHPDNDQVWGDLTLRRYAELSSGAVLAIPVEQVLAKVRERLKQ